MKNYRTDKQIVDDAPKMAVTYCMYDYGDDMEGVYLNCENQFFEEGQREWLEMNSIENYFHSHRRIDDIRKIVRMENLFQSE